MPQPVDTSNLKILNFSPFIRYSKISLLFLHQGSNVPAPATRPGYSLMQDATYSFAKPRKPPCINTIFSISDFLARLHRLSMVNDLSPYPSGTIFCSFPVAQIPFPSPIALSSPSAPKPVSVSKACACASIIFMLSSIISLVNVVKNNIQMSKNDTKTQKLPCY